jgi:hypothetical protein
MDGWIYLKYDKGWGLGSVWHYTLNECPGAVKRVLLFRTLKVFWKQENMSKLSNKKPQGTELGRLQT